MSFRCQSCDGSDRTIVYRDLPDRFYALGSGFAYARCRACGLFQLDEVPELGAYYKAYRVHERESLAYRLLRRALIGSSYHFPEGTPGRVLDIGCGNGWYLEEMRSRGWRIAGFELDPEYAATLASRLGAPIYTDPAAIEGPFDLVTFNFSFEHLDRPRGYLEMAHRCLAPGGELYLAVPNIEGREARLFQERWFHLDAPRHVALFGKQQLARVLGEHGFEHVETRDLPVPTGFAGSVSYRLRGAFSTPIWYAAMAPGLVFCRIVRDGNFGITARKAQATGSTS
ncbi:MAG: class I SAM-dependent methyltransferase [Kofleriaceae bacterium]